MRGLRKANGGEGRDPIGSGPPPTGLTDPRLAVATIEAARVAAVATVNTKMAAHTARRAHELLDELRAAVEAAGAANPFLAALPFAMSLPLGGDHTSACITWSWA